MNDHPQALEAQWGEAFGTLASAFASGDRDAFMLALDRIGAMRENSLYRDLGALTESLQFALDQFRLDSRLATLAGRDVPDARLRLDHVLKLTEDGAHKTLDLVERSCPLADRTARDAAALSASVRAHRSSPIGPTEVGELLLKIDHFLIATQRDSEAVRTNLSDVLMAQSYQDLSGQIIRGVISLVAEVERTLSHFAALAGDHTANPSTAPSHAQINNGFGPPIPGVTGDAVGEQDDVDALLAGLGM